MGIFASSDIFQTKLYDLLGDTKAVKTYINDILEPGKGGFYLYIDQLRVIFASLGAAGLRFNAH